MSDLELARGVMAGARRMFGDHVRGLTLEQSLVSAGGWRSGLGVIKHLGGWAHVYRSYAFDAQPRHWYETSWPRGFRDTVDTSQEYLDEVVAWADSALQQWDDNLAGLNTGDLESRRSLHWGATAPLSEIVVMAAHHVVYHTGELNMLLSIAREQAWEYTEEVEENHISSYGHGVRAEWMSDEQAHRHEEALRVARDERLARAQR